MSKALSYTLVFLGIQLLASGLVTTGFSLWGNEALTQSPYVLMGASLLGSLITIILFVVCRWAQPTTDYLRSRPRMVIFWSLLTALGIVIPSAAIQEQLPELPNLIEKELGDVMSAHGGYFVICLLAPFTEELVFRGAILRSLLAWKPTQRWGMIAISALLFALIHLNPAQMPHAFVIGMLLGWMYERTGSIVPSVVYHWANNTVAFLIYRLYPDPDIRLIDLLGTQRNVAAAVMFSLFILVPAIYQLNLWMKHVDK